VYIDYFVKITTDIETTPESMSQNKYNTVSLIRKKRDGKELDSEEIHFLVNNYSRDNLADYQMSAFLMAAFLQGLTDTEAAALTKSMLHSGVVLDLSDIPGKKVDKHSTGGVGDKLSLILAPIVASCGVPVPMISGRGLGHTGGTLDKLESIPGFTVDMTLGRYREILEKHNLVLAGQTEEIAPADKRLYALRDVTATVESIPLIAGSIMSKKLAEGIDALVLDVKYGSGAFMSKHEEAVELAQILVGIGEEFGKQTIAYLTDMDQPLGFAVGNWLEVREGIACLRGDGPDDVMEISHLLAGTMIYLGEHAESVEEGVEKSKKAIEDGSAWNKWIDIVKEQGGDTGVIENPASYTETEFIHEIIADHEGYIHAMDAYEIGMVSLELGAGRRTKEDSIDPAAGIILKRKTGDEIKKGETIARFYTNNSEVLGNAERKFIDAISISETKPTERKLISHKVDKNGLHPYNR
jgi:pyrimidine-nucleoside phosphorylase